MGVLDDAIREHLELKRSHGASDQEIARVEAEALGPARREASAGNGDETQVMAGQAVSLDEHAPPTTAPATDAPPPPPGLGAAPSTPDSAPPASAVAPEPAPPIAAQPAETVHAPEPPDDPRDGEHTAPTDAADPHHDAGAAANVHLDTVEFNALAPPPASDLPHERPAAFTESAPAEHEPFADPGDSHEVAPPPPAGHSEPPAHAADDTRLMELPGADPEAEHHHEEQPHKRGWFRRGKPASDFDFDG